MPVNHPATQPKSGKASARKPKSAAPTGKTAKRGPRAAVAAPVDPFRVWVADADRAMAGLVDHIAAGGSLASFCRTRSIASSTVRAWVDASTDRAARYARAREDAADFLAEEIVSIADEVQGTVQLSPDGEPVAIVLDSAAVARNRLRVDARKWVASKLKPKAYGDRLDLTAKVGAGSLQELADYLAANAAPLPICHKPDGED